MPAYSVPIERPVCACGKPATREVRNRWNEKIRACCDACARLLVASLNAPRETTT